MPSTLRQWDMMPGSGFSLIQPSAGGGGGAGPVWRGNEPTGMTQITDRPFNSKTEDPNWDNFNAGPMTIEVDATAPKTPSNVLRETYPAGFDGTGNSHGSCGIVFPTTHGVVYACYWIKYSPNFQGHDSGINKQHYVWVHDGGDTGIFVMEAEGSGSNPLKPRPVIQSAIVGTNNYNPGTNNGASDIDVNKKFVRDVWAMGEFLIKPNTAGNADGGFDVWVDGVHTHSYGGIQWTVGNTQFFQFEIQPVWGGTTSISVISDMWIQWDHLYVSAKN